MPETTFPNEIRTLEGCRRCGKHLYARPVLSHDQVLNVIASPNPWFPYTPESEQTPDRLQIHLACKDVDCWGGTYSVSPPRINQRWGEADRGTMLQEARDYVFNKLKPHGN